jgi:sterol desaturase/sphingolipid hydroxylase (fatty acid hydroxylase superfamily)
MDYIALAIPLFFVLMGAELAWSAYTHRKVYRFNDFVANLGCGIGSQVVGAFSKTLIFAAYLWTYDHARLFTLERSVLTWIVAFLLVDLLYYWFHRLSHEVNFLWAAHIVHHQSEEYNLSVALRQSWWQGLFSWWFYLPMAVLGIHPVVIVTVGAFNTLYQFWIHTKAIGTMGPFEWLFNTPSHHRVHHGSDPKYIDRNHAGTLIVWDKLFGTFQREEEEPVYGITTPLSRWDPLTANFHYWGDLFRLAAQARTWGDKLRVFMKPPGWRLRGRAIHAAAGGHHLLPVPPGRPGRHPPVGHRRADRGLGDEHGPADGGPALGRGRGSAAHGRAVHAALVQLRPAVRCYDTCREHLGDPGLHGAAVERRPRNGFNAHEQHGNTG